MKLENNELDSGQGQGPAAFSLAELECALIYLEKAYKGKTTELGKKIGVKRPTISVLLKKRITTERNAKQLIELWKKETASKIDGKSKMEAAAASTAAAESQPLGHIPFKGHDRDRSWEMFVPVYAEEARNEAMMRVAERLLKVARGQTAEDTASTAPTGTTAARGGDGGGNSPSIPHSTGLDSLQGLATEIQVSHVQHVQGQGNAIIPFHSLS